MANFFQKFVKIYNRFVKTLSRDVSGMRPKKILIVSNCQVQPLKHGLSAVCKNLQIDALGVHILPAEEREVVLKQYLDRKDDYDFVLTIPLSDDFNLFSKSKIVESFYPTPVFKLSNLTFRGLHPDITYIGVMMDRAPGPIGDYHSQLALLAFLMKLPVTTAVKMYRHEVYNYLGYYDEYAMALAEMTHRDLDSDIPIGDTLQIALKNGLCFLSHNHPTNFLMVNFINKISDWLAERKLVDHSGLVLQAEEMVNFLAYSSVFPVYPEIAHHHGMPYEGSYVFRGATVGDVPTSPIDLFEFVSGEYEAFLQMDEQVLKQSYPGNMLLQNFGLQPEFRDLILSF